MEVIGWPPEEVRGERKGKIAEELFGCALKVCVSLVKEQKRKDSDEMREWKYKKPHKKAMWDDFEKCL